jgi:hypothetical protein
MIVLPIATTQVVGEISPTRRRLSALKKTSAVRFLRACARSQDLRKKTHNGSRHALSSAHAPAVLDKHRRALGEQALQRGITTLRACAMGEFPPPPICPTYRQT